MVKVKQYCYKTVPRFLFRAAVFTHLKSLFAARFKLCKLSFVLSECSCVRACVCACACVRARVCVCVCARARARAGGIVSMDKILRFTDTSVTVLLL